VTPTVVIATHKRVPITCANIDSLLKQTVVPNIVLVVSKGSEEKLFRENYPTIHVIVTENNPLGSKWQAGIDEAFRLGADPVIITGSDDILERRFVERACLWMDRDFDFIGLKQWYVFFEGKLYRFKYNAYMPLGGGRVYSRRFLNQAGPIFDARDRHLDDFGWNKVFEANVRRLVWSDPLILSVKGEWDVMNSARAFFGSRNCQCMGEFDRIIMQKEFNYG